MSTNLHISATREVIVVKTGRKSQQTISFHAFQTPTKVTYDILSKEDKAQAYRDWVLSTSQDVQEPVYAEDDIFGEREPVTYETYNSGKEHIEVFDQWLAEVVDDGYEVQYSAW